MLRSTCLLLLALVQSIGHSQELLKTWQPLKAVEGIQQVQKMAVATDGTLVLILTRDNRVRVFDPLKKESLRIVEGFPQPIVAMAASGLKGLVLLASKSTVFSLTATGTEPPRKLWETPETIYSLTSTSVREFAAVATSDGAFILNTRTGDLALSNRDATCLAAKFAPNEKTLALALGKKVVIYDLPTFVQKQVWSTNGFVYSLAFAPNSEFIAVGGEGNSLTLKRLGDGQTMKNLSLGVSSKQVDHLAFATDQSALFVGVGDRLVVFDNLNLEKPIARPIKLEEKIHSLGFSIISESLFAGIENTRNLLMWGVSIPKPLESLAEFQTLRPPTLTLISPAPEMHLKESKVDLVFKVESNARQPVTSIRVLVDGRPGIVTLPSATPETAPASSNGVLKQTFVDGLEYRYLIEVPRQDATLVLLAETPLATSQPKVSKLRWDDYGSAVPRSKSAKPIVTILEPGSDPVIKKRNLELKIKVVSAVEYPMTTLRVLIDGKPVQGLQFREVKPSSSATRSLAEVTDALLRQDVGYVSLIVPAKDSSIMVYADTAQASSDPDVLNLQWEKKDILSLPTLYLLAVGVSQYRDAAYSLLFPAKDASDFTTLMERQRGKHYKDVKVRLLVNDQATRDNVLDGLDWLAKEVTQKDMALVFIAGHGINHFSTSNYYFMPHDAKLDFPVRTMVPGNEVHAILSRLQGKRLLLMDTCHAGNVAGTGQRAIADMDKFIRDFSQAGQGLVVFAGSKGAGTAVEDEKWGNGAFTKALLEGLNGKGGKDGDGLFTWKMLDNYITQRVKDLTGGKQQPTTTPTPDTSDFSIALIEEK